MKLGEVKTTPSPRPKMTREQLAEMIRANVAAFKEDENFCDYLTDLIIYLMEYEYDWPDQTTRNDMLQVQSQRQEFIQQIASGKRVAMTMEGRMCRICGADLQGRDICPCCLARNRK